MNIIYKSSIPNPRILVPLTEFDNPENILVADSNPDENTYIELCQCCSVMSVAWLKSRKTKFNDFSKGEQDDMVLTLLSNTSPEQQVDWGKSMINGTIWDINDINLTQENAKILIFNKHHVTEAIIKNDYFIQFEPENGEECIYTLNVFKELFSEAIIVVG